LETRLELLFEVLGVVGVVNQRATLHALLHALREAARRGPGVDKPALSSTA
jgi:hypothetical protein